MAKNSPSNSAESSLNTHVKIKIQNEDRVLCYRIQRDARLLKLMKKYAERIGVDQKTIRFLYDGRRIKDSDTAESLEMEDDAEINALSEQSGGGTPRVT
ncbi:hypothetical protein ACJIZ3_008606 [Penstemon smallii]|uniref:Small ubiquitin-related modifier n=1 Tax=Penstemon smallii TaxID=265156 RepID=A0ABD3TA81_9LAMI